MKLTLPGRAHALGLALLLTASASALAAAPTAIATANAKAATTAAPVAVAGTLPADSVYQLKLALTDQQGRTVALDAGRGHPVLVSMFYTSCEFVCPMLVDALRDTEAKLNPAERAKTSVLLVTFDPARDTVAVLQKTAAQRELDPGHWTLARTDPASVRKLAAVLGVQYRLLANGDYNHTTALVLLDAQGRVAGRTTQLGDADPAFVKRVKAAVQGAAR